jgi:hypothetical protein
MTPIPRHQCLIYEGSPSLHLVMLAAVVRKKLKENHRCLYFNSDPMVAALCSHLVGAAVDVAEEIKRGSLVLTSSQGHLIDGRHFDVDRMIHSLEDALNQALRDGYEGLWTTGDMTWEFGSEGDFSKLVEYEWRVEQLLSSRPQLGGICQYHADKLPRSVVRHGLVTHRSLFINETLSRINPHYLPPEEFSPERSATPEIEAAVDLLCSSGLAS